MNIKHRMAFIALLGLLGLSACTTVETENSDNDQGTVVAEEDQSEHDQTNATESSQGNKGNGNNTIEIDWSLKPEPTVVYDKADYSLGDMLNLALQDEYAARHEYELVITQFGDEQPFSSIIESEVSHIESLLPLFDSYGFVVPQDESDVRVVIPDTFEQALETCVQAEVNNITMYDRFLQEDLGDDVRSTFEMLKAASESHLESFMGALQRQE